MNENLKSNDWDFIWQNLNEGMARNPGRDYRFKQILALIPRGTELRVLDFGCGTGNLIYLLKEEFPLNKYYGSDTSTEALRITKSKIPLIETIHIKLDDNLPSMQMPEEYFDLVICSEVLEHIDNDVETVSFIYKFVKPGGKLICTVPAGPISVFDRFIGHRRHYSQASLKFTLEMGGFRNVTIRRSGFPAINLVRIFAIISRKRLARQLQNNNYGETGVSGKLVKILRFVFRFALEDSVLGWQLISTSLKPKAEK